jgi:hypothetical protein
MCMPILLQHTLNYGAVGPYSAVVLPEIPCRHILLAASFLLSDCQQLSDPP